ncbi:ATF1 [Candida theae]|uniref:ATF1 n=1 Tax=Candida theae TaxID=1198502 RepID=A0AAD5BBF4_9ASCO|nr:ATF1 [Candida theae]KAI5950479.1 ATF1 [Candida theae]
MMEGGSGDNILISRPLSVSENFFRSRTASGNYRNFQVTATYRPGLKKNWKLFYYALRKTILDYHILITNVQFCTSVDSFVYKPLDKVNFASVVQVIETRDYVTSDTVNEKFMKFVNGIKFDLYSQNPLFRLIIVGEDHLCAVFEHTIADGLVARYIHEILLQNIAHCDNLSKWSILEKEYGFEEVDDPFNAELFNINRDQKFIKNSLPPPIDLFLSMEEDYTGGDSQFSELVVPSNAKGKWLGRFPAIDVHDIAFKLINIPAQETRKILEKCRAQQVSITAYIEVVFAFTMWPIFDGKYASYKCAMALRRHMDVKTAPKQYTSIFNQPGYKILGTSAHMGFGMNLPPITEFSWELVRKINSHIVSGCRNKRALNQLKGFKDNADMKDRSNEYFFKKQLNNPKADAVKISNLGFVQETEHRSEQGRTWTIKNMVFAQDMAPYASEFMLNVITTAKGGLNMTLSYYDHTFEDSKWDNFDHFVEKLQRNMVECIE